MLFENDPEFATAPAQNVTIYVPIHTKLNPSSLRISDFGFGRFNFSVPPNTSVYTNRLDVRDSLGVFVDITAGLDVTNRRAFWIFQSIDPATGLAATLPANTGFLPVNDSLKHNGEGYVTFSLLPLSNSQTQDTISARASIIFDVEEIIATNLWKNTIDAGVPQSKVKPMAAEAQVRSFNVTWEGADDAQGVGIREYSLYVSENGGVFSLYKSGLTTTSTQFTGAVGNTYGFFTLATDHVGNQEAMKSKADVSVKILAETGLPLRWLFFKGKPTVEGVYLSWATVWEVNTDHFVIERSLDGKHFTDLGKITAAGESRETRNYQYLDVEALQLKTNVLYYRLVQVDKDGIRSHSSIISVQLIPGGPEPTVKAYPNPFKQNLTLEFVNLTPTAERDQVILYSADGKSLYKKSLKNANGSTILLDELPVLPRGVYVLRVSIQDKQYTFRMIRE
ncbi:hypothetical protein BWI96_10520 [Siphonobacter sp. SORGH_AS_0500]|uniref:T9SS type A sorting domain-containing protein n=1 Tax=Siphonobacter sp. SORGH_AS_0500 TaxID=1864824 RepID=UPI000CC28A43|nr:T9SS type A sorting domain-containing protein [Siphonobacter sp. SORGH_AS_0500]PKK36796.1 hypothetical protein BWI96_10520 [Siphonobacter sp. SORGH_AS_0500]